MQGACHFAMGLPKNSGGRSKREGAAQKCRGLVILQGNCSKIKGAEIKGMGPLKNLIASAQKLVRELKNGGVFSKRHVPIKK